jgi:hypothetical protein
MLAWRDASGIPAFAGMTEVVIPAEAGISGSNQEKVVQTARAGRVHSFLRRQRGAAHQGFPPSRE